MRSKTDAGMRGQQVAEGFLRSKGWFVLERNYCARVGEIDLIARDGEYVVFAEVKYRTGYMYGFPREAVTAAKQRRIKQTALYYIAENPRADQDFRFDVVEVVERGGQIEINHIENAFQ